MHICITRPQWVNPCLTEFRVDSRYAPSQWEMALLCNDISLWLGASLESGLWIWFRNPKIYFHFLSYLNAKMAQVVEMFHSGRQEPLYAAYSVSCLLMTWQCKEPGHQQPWCWHNSGFSTTRVNSLAPENRDMFLNLYFQNLFYEVISWALLVKLQSDEYNKVP